MMDQPAEEPNDLARFFVERANAGDVAGIVGLFEPDAVITGPHGGDIAGHEAIRAKHAAVLLRRPRFSLGNQQPAMIKATARTRCQQQQPQCSRKAPAAIGPFHTTHAFDQLYRGSTGNRYRS